MSQEPCFKISQADAVWLGWHLTNRPSGETWLNHGGGTLGYTANVLVDVVKKSAVIAISNLNSINHWAQKLFDCCCEIMQTKQNASPTNDENS